METSSSRKVAEVVRDEVAGLTSIPFNEL